MPDSSICLRLVLMIRLLLAAFYEKNNIKLHFLLPRLRLLRDFFAHVVLFMYAEERIWKFFCVLFGLLINFGFFDFDSFLSPPNEKIFLSRKRFKLDFILKLLI